MNYTALTYEQFKTDPVLIAGFVESYKNVFGEDICGGCPGALKDAWNRYQRKYYVNLPVNNNVMSKYRLKNGVKIVRGFNMNPLTNDNITDAKVEALLEKYPSLITKFDVNEPPAEISASKAAIKYADANGIELSTVTGTGKNGLIKLSDVKND